MLKFDIYLNNNELLHSFNSHIETISQIQYIDKYTDYELSDIYIKVYGFKHNKPKVFLIDDFLLFARVYYEENKRKPMRLEDLELLLKYVHSRHPYALSLKSVKYLCPAFDMRTGRIYQVSMYVETEDKRFSLTNEDADKNLLKWIIFYLENLDY